MGHGAPDHSGLVSRAIAGDAEAFSELARRERTRLEALGRRWFSDAYLAEELAQETLVQAARSIGSLREPGAFGPWLYSIARNVARVRWRSQEPVQTFGTVAIPTSACLPDPAEELALRSDLQRATRTLPETQQQVVSLCLLQGDSVQEAAEALAVSPQMVKGRLQRARETLRKELRHTMPQETQPPAPTVLVVDDERHIVRLVEHHLQRAGYRVATAFDGVEALRWLDDTTPRLIVLDLMMPKLHGWDVLRRVRARPETLSTPVLILSAAKSDDPRNAICHELADLYMEKPFDPAQLVTWVDRRLGHLSPAAAQEMVQWRSLRFSDRLTPAAAVEGLGAQYAGVRGEAQRLLSEMGEAALDALAAGVRSGSEQVALKSVDLLAALLVGPHPPVRVASGPFVHRAAREAAAALGAALRRPERTVRWAAYEALAAQPGTPSMAVIQQSGGPVLSEMVAALGDADEGLRRIAEVTLGHLHTPEAFRALRASYTAALSSEDRSTRWQALASLDDKGGVEGLGEARRAASAVAAELVAATRGEDCVLRREAIITMSRVCLPEVTEALEGLAQSDVQEADLAAWALEWQER